MSVPARVALAPQSTNDGLVEVNLDVAATGAGLVFRYADLSNFWSITVDPDTLRWSVTQRVNGADTAVTDFVAPIFHNVTVTVTQNGSTVRFLVNGVEYGRLFGPRAAHRPAHRVGGAGNRHGGGTLGPLPAHVTRTGRRRRFVTESDQRLPSPLDHGRIGP